MKEITKDYIKKILKDSWWLSLTITNIVFTVISIIVIMASIQPKEAQVFTHYSGFGVTGLYKGYWYSLFGYVALALVILVTHVLLSIKLHQLNKRDLALALLWGTLGMTILLTIFAKLIIGVAALG